MHALCKGQMRYSKGNLLTHHVDSCNFIPGAPGYFSNSTAPGVSTGETNGSAVGIEVHHPHEPPMSLRKYVTQHACALCMFITSSQRKPRGQSVAKIHPCDWAWSALPLQDLHLVPPSSSRFGRLFEVLARSSGRERSPRHVLLAQGEKGSAEMLCDSTLVMMRSHHHHQCRTQHAAPPCIDACTAWKNLEDLLA